MNSIRTTLTKLTARVRSARGQSFVEFALLLPVMLVLVLGTVDLGRAYFSSVALENAVKEGAFFGAREPECATTTADCVDPHNVESRVEVELNGLTLQSFVAKCFAPGTTVFTGAGKALADCEDGDLYYVASKTPFTLVTPLISSLVGGTLTLSSSSTAVVVTSFETGFRYGPDSDNRADVNAGTVELHGPELHDRADQDQRRRERVGRPSRASLRRISRRTVATGRTSCGRAYRPGRLGRV